MRRSLPTSDFRHTLRLDTIIHLTSNCRSCSIPIRICISWAAMYFVTPSHNCDTIPLLLFPPPLLARPPLLRASSASGALRLLVAGHSTRCPENTRSVGRRTALHVRRAARNLATRTWPHSRNRPPLFRSELHTDSRGRRPDGCPPRSPSSG